MGPFGVFMASGGGQKWPIKRPKKPLKWEKIDKNESIVQLSPVFWLVGGARHETWGTRPYGTLWGIYGLRGGQKWPIKGPKNA